MISTRFLIFCWILILLKASTLLAQQKLGQYLTAQVEANAFKGSVYIHHQGEEVLNEAYGLAHAEFNIPNTPKTKFLIGSVTKPITALAVIKVFAKRDLSLESPIAEFGYDFLGSKEIRITHLLRHSSGLMDYPDLVEAAHWEQFARMGGNRKQLIKEVVELGLKFEPGKGFRYSNTGYIILGSILEDLTGKPFSQVIEEEITLPYGLEDTGVMENRKVVSELATGYTSDPRRVKHAAYVDYSVPFSSGNMYATSRDLFRFWEALQEDPELPQSIRDHLFPHKGEKYAFGWANRNFFGREAYGHYGRMSGFVSSLVYIEAEDLFISFVSNDDHTKLYGITRDLIAIVLGETYEIPKVRKLVDLDQEVFEPYIGSYKIAEGDTIKVFVEDGYFYIQETGQMRHEIFPFEQHKFFFSLLEFELLFEAIRQNKAGKLILRRKEIIGERIP